MRLVVNGEHRDTSATDLAALWASETEHLRAPAEADGPAPSSRRGFAIALNGVVVRAARWDETVVRDGDRVEIIRAVAGG